MVIRNPINNYEIEAEVFMDTIKYPNVISILPHIRPSVEIDVVFEGRLASEQDPRILHAAKVALRSYLEDGADKT